MAENVGRRGETWFFRIDLPDGLDGKRRQKRVSGFATERQARRALAQAKVDIDAGRLRHEARCTVGDLANEWFEAVRPNRKASTFSNWDRLMRAYVVPASATLAWTAFRQLSSRGCTPNCAVQALGKGASPRPALRSATSTGSCTTPSTMRCASVTSRVTRPTPSTSPVTTRKSGPSTLRNRFAA